MKTCERCGVEEREKMIGARVQQCLRQFHNLDTAGRGLQCKQRGDGAGLEKQPVWSDKKRADQGADRERWRQRQEERFGGVLRMGDGGWHVFKTKEKKWLAIACDHK